MSWIDGSITVPFGNPNFDSALGGSHDLAVGCQPNTPVTLLLDGTVSDLSSPSWGKQVCLLLANPVNGVPYMGYLHLAAINPTLSQGQAIKAGTVIGWSGGCYDASQYDGTSNPTGENFVDAIFMSSQPQVGIALHRGVAYGGAGWETFPPIDTALDPTGILETARKAEANPPAPSPGIVHQAGLTWQVTGKLLVLVYGKTAPQNTGIYRLWFKAFTSGKRNCGAPMTIELPMVNWAQTWGVCQWFMNGDRIEWFNGVGTIYNAANQKVY